MTDLHFIVPHQSARLDQPAESSLDDPAFRQNLESFDIIASLDDLKFHPAMAFDLRSFLFKLPRVATVRPDQLEPAERGCQHGEEQAGAIPVLHIRRGDFQGQDVAERIYQDVSLSSCNFLTRIKATKSGLASCANALTIDNRSGRGFFLPCASRAMSLSE